MSSDFQGRLLSKKNGAGTQRAPAPYRINETISLYYNFVRKSSIIYNFVILVAFFLIQSKGSIFSNMLLQIQNLIP